MEEEGLALSCSAALVEERIDRFFTPPASTQSSLVTVIPVGGATDQAANLSAGLQDLRDIVSAFSSHSPLQLSPEVEVLIERAAQAHGTPGDVEAWAHRLAEDVRDLGD